MNNIKLEDVISNDQEHAFCLEQIDKLMDGDPERDSLEGVTLRLLASVAEAYEKKRWPIGGDKP